MKREYLHIRPDINHLERIDDKHTFFGVLNRYYAYEITDGKKGRIDGISKNWNAESTLKNNKNDYENVIFPQIPEKALEDMTKEDFDEIIQNIEKLRGRGGRPYSPARLQGFKRLLKAVTEEAAKQGICNDVLFGSSYAIPESEARGKSLKKELVRLQKSLSIREEYLIVKSILEDPYQSGQHMGLALMFCLGLRNEEACGLDFGDMKPMQYHKPDSCLWVYKSTKRGTNELQPSGKTRNMARLLPVPAILLRLLTERRKFLELEVAAGRLILPAHTSVDNLPIVCMNEDYLTRCNSKHLTAAGRQLLKEVDVKEDELAYIDIELEENRLVEDGIDEKDPTVYLFRRNLGTHLYILGLTEAEIQYVMGHEIEDPYENRNDFTNEDKLYQIKLKMDQRPLVNEIEPSSVTEVNVSDHYYESFQNQTQKKLHVASDAPVQIKLQSSACVPQNDIHMDVVYQNAVLRFGELHALAGYTTPVARTVNVTQQYHDVYQKALARTQNLQKNESEAEL